MLQPITGARIGKGLAGNKEVLFTNGDIVTDKDIDRHRYWHEEESTFNKNISTRWYFARKRGDMRCYEASGLDKEVARIVEEASYDETGRGP